MGAERKLRGRPTKSIYGVSKHLGRPKGADRGQRAAISYESIHEVANDQISKATLYCRNAHSGPKAIDQPIANPFEPRGTRWAHQLFFGLTSAFTILLEDNLYDKKAI
jgi:hypothetical protein